MRTFHWFIFVVGTLLFSQLATAQALTELHPPYHIKTIRFAQGGQTTLPIFRLGDSFELSFDDLYGDEANYYYKIYHCDYDWKPSQLAINEYLRGLDNQRIIDYENSFNTLQIYSHYRLRFPNQFTQGFKVSGNYMLEILDDKGEPVFSRKFVLFENMVGVPVQVKNPRNVAVLNSKHNLEFSVIPDQNTILQDPIKNIRVLLLQNGFWHTAIGNIKPMFTIGNKLEYRYDAETQFWAGNEFLFFDNKDIRNATNNVRYIESKGGIYNHYLMPNAARASQPYTFAPDANGIFMVRNIMAAENSDVEADYTWVFFELDAPLLSNKKDVYIGGMFNNFALKDEYKMEYNSKTGRYEKALIMKQGFTNYQFLLADDRKRIDFENAIDGNFFQTENNYIVLVYYRPNNGRYDQVIGKGSASSVDIIN